MTKDANTPQSDQDRRTIALIELIANQVRAAIESGGLPKIRVPARGPVWSPAPHSTSGCGSPFPASRARRCARPYRRTFPLWANPSSSPSLSRRAPLNARAGLFSRCAH